MGRLGVQKFSLDPEQPRIEEEDMPEWLRRVEAMSNPIRRDLQDAALFTGMRTENVTKIRWESVDWERGGLFVPRSKTTPSTIPLSTTVMDILRRRRDENAVVFEKYRGDRGWVFPALSADEKVIPIAARNAATTRSRRPGSSTVRRRPSTFQPKNGCSISPASTRCVAPS